LFKKYSFNFPVCDRCEKYIHGQQCDRHVFTIVANTAPKTRCGSKYAVRTLPANLLVKRSTIPHAGKGVFAKDKITERTRFGPYTGVKIDFKSINGMDTSYMWEVRFCSLIA
jgi:hypothetical protein